MKIKKVDSFMVVGIQVVAEWRDLAVEMPKAWQRFFEQHSRIMHKLSDRCMDISLGKKGHGYVQLICAEVSQFVDVPQGMVSVKIPARNYIHYRHTGPLKDIAASFEKMTEWAGQKRYRLSDMKLDIGYTQQGLEKEHDLFVQVLN